MFVYVLKCLMRRVSSLHVLADVLIINEDFLVHTISQRKYYETCGRKKHIYISKLADVLT